jgi:phosphoribosylanthranilate isomerase
MKNPIIQAAGILDLEDAKTLISAGFTHLGYPLELDFHAEDMTKDEVKNVVSVTKDQAVHVVITYLDKASKIIELLKQTGTSWVQLHGEIKLDELKALKISKPDVTVIKSLVIGKTSIEEVYKTLNSHSDFCDYFITDTYDPETGASGATGKTHDWEISSEICKRSKKPVIIAGGLKPSNISQAIKQTMPAGVDVHTGIEGSDGRKDLKLSSNFVEKTISAYNVNSDQN